MEHYFITKGSGQSNLNCSKNETTSYDDALVHAGIGNINVVLLSSMIPPKASEINPINLQWGDIIHCIMARNDGKKGKIISCALLISEIYHGSKLLGSFVLEYSGHGNEKVAQKNLFLDLVDMIRRRGYGNVPTLKMYSQHTTQNGYTILPKKFIYNRQKVEKRYGTVVCTICFVK